MQNNEELIKIKKTKSVEMHYSPKDDAVYLMMLEDEMILQTMMIPMSKVKQVQRGLLSLVQRFYRKKK